MKIETQQKVDKLKQIIKEMDSVLVAYSGGVDSTFLLKMAVDVLGVGKVGAFIISSQVYPEWETAEANCNAQLMGVKVHNVSQDILLIPAYRENKEDRCYHCKREMLMTAKAVAQKHGYKWVLEGTNADEARDWRPGLKAVHETGARSPLLEAGFTKEEIREVSKELNLPTWDKPSMACLSSRFPVGVEITPDKLKQVAHCENALREEGVKQFRVRYHGNLARIETTPSEFAKILNSESRKRIIRSFKEAGFKYITLDLEGYRTGSMNPIPKTENKG